MFGPGGQIDHLTFAGMRGGGKGGGGGSPVFQGPTQYTDPVNGMTFDTADALNAEIANRVAQDKALSDQQAADASSKAAQSEADFQSRLTTAKNQGATGVLQYFRDQGFNPDQYGGQIHNALEAAGNSVADLDPNPMSAFPSTLGAQIVNQITSGRQSQANAAISKLFGPQYVNTSLPLDATESAITDVLNTQFNPLSDQLQNAVKRGTLNDKGYAAALDKLASDKTAAQAQLNTLGSGIINNDRAALQSYISGAKNDASNLTLNTADLFDPNSYSTEASSMISRDLANLPGDLKNAVGNSSFSDLTSLLNAGGAVQGATNPTATNPIGAVGPGGSPIGGSGVSPSYIADQVLANTKRGLGTQGAF